jgi:hypothetical protein
MAPTAKPPYKKRRDSLAARAFIFKPILQPPAPEVNATKIQKKRPKNHQSCGASLRQVPHTHWRNTP